jgi:hypothetical protein
MYVLNAARLKQDGSSKVAFARIPKARPTRTEKAPEQSG